eukprot:tig00000681_g3110.t1
MSAARYTAGQEDDVAPAEGALGMAGPCRQGSESSGTSDTPTAANSLPLSSDGTSASQASLERTQWTSEQESLLVGWGRALARLREYHLSAKRFYWAWEYAMTVPSLLLSTTVTVLIAIQTFSGKTDDLLRAMPCSCRGTFDPGTGAWAFPGVSTPVPGVVAVASSHRRRGPHLHTPATAAAVFVVAGTAAVAAAALWRPAATPCGFSVKDQKSATHLLMTGGKIRIPPEREDEFLARYAADVALGHGQLFFVEKRTPVFRLFADLDFLDDRPYDLATDVRPLRRRWRRAPSVETDRSARSATTRYVWP